MGEADVLADRLPARVRPDAIAVGWILVFHQPHSTLWRGHVTNWSSDIGIAGIVKDMGGAC